MSYVNNVVAHETLLTLIIPSFGFTSTSCLFFVDVLFRVSHFRRCDFGSHLFARRFPAPCTISMRIWPVTVRYPAFYWHFPPSTSTSVATFNVCTVILYLTYTQTCAIARVCTRRYTENHCPRRFDKLAPILLVHLSSRLFPPYVSCLS